MEEGGPIFATYTCRLGLVRITPINVTAQLCSKSCAGTAEREGAPPPTYLRTRACLAHSACRSGALAPPSHVRPRWSIPPAEIDSLFVHGLILLQLLASEGRRRVHDDVPTVDMGTGLPRANGLRARVACTAAGPRGAKRESRNFKGRAGKEEGARLEPSFSRFFILGHSA